jgi:hypothetical protein
MAQKIKNKRKDGFMSIKKSSRKPKKKDYQ